jgi:hypothetical protein
LLAISKFKKGKAVEVNEILAEMLKTLRRKALQEVCDICQSMYEEGKRSDDFARATMIPCTKEQKNVHEKGCGYTGG